MSYWMTDTPEEKNQIQMKTVLTGFVSLSASLLATVLAGDVVAESQFVDRIAVVSNTTIPTPRGALRPNQVLIHDGFGHLDILDIGFPLATSIAAISLSDVGEFAVSRVSFLNSDQSIPKGAVLRINDNLVPDSLNEFVPFPVEAGISALSVSKDGLYISPETIVDTTIGVIYPHDIIFVSPTQASLYFDGSDAGLPANARLSAFDVLDNSIVYLSFDTHLEIDGNFFKRGDIVQFSSTPAPQFSLFIPRNELFGQCSTCSVSAISLDVEPDIIFKDAFYSPW